MYRFYTPNLDLSKDDVILANAKERHHLQHVLRLKAGTVVYLFDGDGNEVQAKINHFEEMRIHFDVVSRNFKSLSVPQIILACAIPKRSKFELIIEKTTELGVAEIYPMITHRTELKMKKEGLHRKDERFSSVAVNAAKQSQRAHVPVIHPIEPFKSVLPVLAERGVTLIPSLIGERKPLWQVIRHLDKPDLISYFIGPEGDFTPQEYEHAFRCGCQSVSLGETILKVETAAICVISALHLFYSDDY